MESRERLYLDREGVVVDREAWRQRMTSWDLCWHVARAGFDGVEGVGAYVDLEKVGEEVKGCWERARYEFGREVVGVKGVDKGVKVKWRSTKGDEEGRSEGVVVCDYLVVADGPSSHVRSMVEEVKRERKYVGYVAFRGTVAETELSDEAKKVFVERFTFYHADGVQILAVSIPQSWPTSNCRAKQELETALTRRSTRYQVRTEAWKSANALSIGCGTKTLMSRIQSMRR